MNNKDFQVRLAAVKHYFSSKDSLRATAKKFNVQFPTIFKWVKAYKQYGAVGLLPQYRRPWNRTERKLEEKIVSLFKK
ncbi:MAG: helix-turn-helix domain-containing protein, partial [candidate division WOR-3 bacterium]